MMRMHVITYVLVRRSRAVRAARHGGQCAGKARARLLQWGISAVASSVTVIKARRYALCTTTGHPRP